jgi:hypothetical protein
MCDVPAGRLRSLIGLTKVNLPSTVYRSRKNGDFYMPLQPDKVSEKKVDKMLPTGLNERS